MSLTLMYITNRPDVALIAEKYGVERIWVDLETLGKNERQKNMDTVKSMHSIDDIRKIKPLLKKSEMLVRVNPWNDNSVQEIEEVLNAGADLIMLPMWKSPNEVLKFIETINKRCKTILLLETKEAVDCLDEVLDIKGIDEIHIGLNDLHISYAKCFMFELLADGTVERITEKIKLKGLPFGFGGIAQLGGGDLPAEKIIKEHYRLGSTRAILSRSFCNTDIVKELPEIEKIFSENMKSLREYEASLADCTDFESNLAEVKEAVANIVKAKKEKMK